MTGRGKVSLGERIKSLSTLTKIVCVVIVVGSVGAGVLLFGELRDAIWFDHFKSYPDDPLTSPDGEWRLSSTWKGDPLGLMGGDGWSRIEAWPVGERDKARVVYYGSDHFRGWAGSHSLKLSYPGSKSISRLDVATEESKPGAYQWDLLVGVAAGVPAAGVAVLGLLAVFLIVGIKSRKPEDGSGASEKTLRS